MGTFELLTSTDIFSAGMLAQQLDEQNAQRKDLTLRVQEQAVFGNADGSESPVMFLRRRSLAKAWWVCALARGRTALSPCHHRFAK